VKWKREKKSQRGYEKKRGDLKKEKGGVESMNL